MIMNNCIFSDLPTCSPSNSQVELGLCKVQTAYLVSATFMGLFSPHTEYEKWEILSSDSKYIELHILDFDIGCESGTLLKIRNDAYYRMFTTSYCNQKKPVGVITSNQDFISVEFVLNGNVLTEGFVARYETKVKHKHITYMPHHYEMGT